MGYQVYVKFKNDPDPDWFPYTGITHDNRDDAINEAAEALQDDHLNIISARIENEDD